jgi:hypothetical protein
VRVGLHRAGRRMRRQLRLKQEARRRSRALLWHRVYTARYRTLIWAARHGAIAAATLLLVLAAVSTLWIPALQGSLEPLFATEERVQGLRSLFQALGGALLGATAIVASLVLFSMQVNVERMPHGLFQRLSTDKRLLGAFAAAFLLALSLAALSLIPDRRLIGAATLGAFWAIILILLLFLYGYRRALLLINPLQQLGIVIAKSRREFRTWVRRAKRAAPLLPDPSPQPEPRDDPFAPKHDLARVAYFQANAHWTDGAKQAVRYAVSFARRYADQGDHEVSQAAMSAIVAINASYVEAKGKTFFANQILFDNPLTSDAFINDTLEHLRQTARIGISRGDEQQIEQTLSAFANLVRVYAAIDYGSPNASKTHAHLAAAYLSGAVERIVPHNMPDVLMEGTRLMGQCADVLLAAEGPNGIPTLVQKLGLIACCGVATEDYRPVTSTCVEQLARLSFNLLRTRSRDVRFAAEEIRNRMTLIAKLFLAVPDTPITNAHSTFLGSYYSATSPQSLSARLVELVNAVAQANADDENVRQVIRNVEQWADRLYQTEKEILLEAVKKRSHFTFDMIHWISHVTGVLIFVSNAPACDEHSRGELRKHALWLISVLSFIPDDLETVRFVENFQMTERLFETALNAHRQNSPDIAEKIADLLVSWMFNGGRFHSGWAILERSMYGLAVLALLAKEDEAIPKLKAKISKHVALLDQDVKDHAALEIRGRAATLWKDHWVSLIEMAMARADHAKLKPLLEELADLISPGTAGKAASQHFF